MPCRPAAQAGGGQGVRSDPESEEFEEKYRAVINGGDPDDEQVGQRWGRVEPALWGRGVTHSPIVPRCLLTARYGSRHNQVLDGSNALSHEKAVQGGYGDGAKRARLQHEARDGDRGRRRIAAGDLGLRPGLTRPIQHLQEAVPVRCQEIDSTELQDQRAQNVPSQPDCGLVERFFTRPGPIADITAGVLPAALLPCGRAR
jgi:hypothetical protein